MHERHRQTDRTGQGRTRQDNGPIALGETVLQTVAQKPSLSVYLYCRQFYTDYKCAFGDLLATNKREC